MIKPLDKTVRGILDDSVRYVVPEYQRNFEWHKEHAEEFFEDISAGSVYFGTLVFDTSKRQKEKETIIVDGQQRLTTIFIFLAACRLRAHQIHSTGQTSAIQSKLSFIDDTTGDSGTPKLEASPSINEIFSQTIVNGIWDGKTFNFTHKKRQIAKIKPIYSYFVDKLSKFNKEEIKDILEKLYDSSFVVIEIEDTQEAFDIFERTNARGMELNAADLLKNYLFARQASDNLSQDWESIIENSSSNILRMIKYYYVSNYGYTPKKRLFKDLKKHGEIIDSKEFLIEYKENTFSLDRFNQYHDKELLIRKTLIGPHRDEYHIYMINKSLAKKDIHMYGSRSEQRLGLFWLKINELKYLESFYGKKPILLLDDIFSELDHYNQKLIFNLIGNYQTVVTSTEKEVIKLINLSDDASYDTINL